MSKTSPILSSGENDLYSQIFPFLGSIYLFCNLKGLDPFYKRYGNIIHNVLNNLFFSNFCTEYTNLSDILSVYI